MGNAIGHQISRHLESLGYEIKDGAKEEEDAPYVCRFSAISSGKPTLWITVTKGNVNYIASLYAGWGNDTADSIDFHEALNEVNALSLYSKWYLRKSENTNIVTIETFFLGYEQKQFGIIVEGFLTDVTKNIPNLVRYLPLKGEK
jgi:hypothetical protein